VPMFRLRRSCAVPTSSQSAEGKTLGDGLPELRKRSRSGSDSRGQTSAMYFDLCAFEKRPGGDDAPVREHLPDSGRRFALLQYLWDATVAVEPIHRSRGNFCLAANEPKITSDL